MALYYTDTKHNQEMADRRARNARNITIGAAILMVIITVLSLIAQFSFNQPIDWSISLLTTVVIFFAVLLTHKNRPVLGIGVLLTALHIVAAYLIFKTSNIGTTNVVIIFFASLAILFETLSPEQNRRILPLLIIADLLMVVVDQVWPFQRSPISDIGTTLFNIVTAILIVIVLVTVFRQFRQYSLRGKLVASTIIVALMAVIVVAFSINTIANRTISQGIGENLQTLVSSHALSIGELLARKINILETLAVNQAITDGVLAQRASYQASIRQDIEGELKALDRTWVSRPDDDPLVSSILNHEMVAELKQFQVVFPDAINLMVTDQFGAPVAATERPLSYYQGNETWWRDTYMSGFGSAYIGRPEHNTDRDEWVVDMAVPIRGEVSTGRTQITGVLHATFSLQAMADIMEAGRFGTTGEVEVHLPGTQVLEVDNGKLSLETNELRQTLEKMSREGLSYASVFHHGVPTLLSAASVNTLSHEPVVDATNWVIVVHQNRAEGLAPITQQGRFNAVIGIVVILLAGSGAWFVGTRLTEPIVSLTDTAVQVAQGDLTARSKVQSADELGTLAVTFNAMTEQVQGAIYNLENRVAERTRALAISIDVGRRLLTIRDQDELVTEVVEQVRDAFDYYHVHIYLLAEDGQTLNMAGGTGEAGQIMLANQHQIPVGKGLVGRAAMTNTVVLVPDVRQEEGWLPNELLPKTMAEAAVPIAMGDEVLGVLDVQADEVGGLTDEDADVLLSITNQVAIALQNARLLEAERERSENEARINEINQKLLKTTTVETALQVAAREIGRAVRAQQARVILKTTNGDNGRQAEVED